MRIDIVPDTYNQSNFNKSVQHPLQTWQWGEARKETGVDVVRLASFDNSSLKDVFTMTLHPLPMVKKYVGYIPRSILPTSDIIDFLRSYSKENNIIFIKFEPYVKHSTGENHHTASIATNMKSAIDTLQLRASPHPLFPDWTQMLNLTKSEEVLLKEMKSKTRYNVKLARRKGIVVKEMSNEQGFKIFLKLYFETCKRQHYFGHNETYHRIIWNNLKNGISHILVAFYENEPLAAYELFHFQDRLYYPYGGSSETMRNLMATNLLMWEAIRFGKKMGAKVFDMWGSLGPDYEKKSKWGGFTKFKEGYGTEFVQFVGSYDLVVDPAMYRLYNLGYALRNWVLTKI
ncbi:peptidoglycan bridge formation glycyltransferase FemA/FemB family protein [Candidatus Woesebacteria bacterium]|nr:peptidoglycan bridge formation glycyltransferase FemA/FemB family protein [Candidatus Woesebacteria bacterium]